MIWLDRQACSPLLLLPLLLPAVAPAGDTMTTAPEPRLKCRVGVPSARTSPAAKISGMLPLLLSSTDCSMRRRRPEVVAAAVAGVSTTTWKEPTSWPLEER